MDLTKAKVHLIVYEPGIRRTIRDLLRNIGVEDIVIGAEFAEFRIAVTENTPDLIIVGATFPDGDVQALIRDLRHNNLGKDPFLPIMSLTSEPTEELVASVASSGSDDLLVYPVSTGHLLTRIEALVENRKPFVVTSEYIGPDRRSADAYVEGLGEVVRIDVPNTLRATVKDNMTPQELSRAIGSALKNVNGQRLGKSGDKIAWLINRVLEGYASGDGGVLDPQIVDFLGQLVKIGSETAKRLPGTGFEHVSYLCETLITMATRMEQTGKDAAETDKELLPQLANAFKTAFIVSDDADISRKIRDTLEKTEPVAATG